MHWSLFCRVVDNYGDAGFCLRLARELRARGQQVDFYIDDPRPLSFMQAGLPDPIEPRLWPAPDAQPALAGLLLECFGCELPEGVQASLGRQPPKLWVNVEYLSAESYVERSHGLPSPVLSGPARGCVKRFCFPGFSKATGGLLRESDLLARQQAHAPEHLWQQLGPPLPGELQISVFSYPDAPLPDLLEELGAPCRLLSFTELALALPRQTRVQPLPFLNQRQYDRLLWSCDLNLVRGEDSFVRAQWAGRPFLWQPYRQQDGADTIKLEAFLSLSQLPAPALRAWNRWPGAGGLAPVLAQSQAYAQWRDQLLLGPDLVNTLLTWAAAAS